MVAAVGVAVQLVYEDLVRETPVRRIAATTLAGQPPPIMAVWGPIDQTIGRIGSGGNILLQLAGFDPNDPQDQQYASLVYYRAVYQLHPRRVYLCRPDQTVNDGRQILSLRFDPDSTWFASHDVRWVIRFRQETGRVSVDLLPATTAMTRDRQERP